MNPSDYFMSVLKERGDELVGEWGKQVRLLPGFPATQCLSVQRVRETSP